MPIDSLVYLDTIYIRDTVFLVDTVFDKTNFHMPIKDLSIDAYKELLIAQRDTYNFITFIFLGLIGLFIGATWLYNTKIAKSVIREETEVIFEREKEGLMKQFREEYKHDLSWLRGESARLFAISVRGEEPLQIVTRIFWWSECAKFYNEMGNGKGVAISIHNIEINLQDAMTKRVDCIDCLPEAFPKFEAEFHKIIESISDELHVEKKKILALAAKLNKKKEE